MQDDEVNVGLADAFMAVFGYKRVSRTVGNVIYPTVPKWEEKRSPCEEESYE